MSRFKKHKSKWSRDNTPEDAGWVERAYKRMEEHEDPNMDMDEYYNNVREGLKELASFCKGVVESGGVQNIKEDKDTK